MMLTTNKKTTGSLFSLFFSGRNQGGSFVLFKHIGVAVIILSVLIAFLHMISGIILFGAALCLLGTHYFKQAKRDWFVAIVYVLLGMTLIVLSFLYL